MSDCYDLIKEIKKKRPEHRFLGDEKFNLDNLDVELKEFTWGNVYSDVSRGPAKKFTVVKSDGAVNDADPQMQVSRTSDVVGKVTLHMYFKGLNTGVITHKIHPDLSDYLPKKFKIHLGKQITELTKDLMTVSVALQVKGDGFTTETEAKKFVFNGDFTCKVKISGDVIIDINGTNATRDLNQLLHTQDDIVYDVGGTLHFESQNQQSFILK